jgi:hypothetical protein
LVKILNLRPQLDAIPEAEVLRLSCGRLRNSESSKAAAWVSSWKNLVNAITSDDEETSRVAKSVSLSKMENDVDKICPLFHP